MTNRVVVRGGSRAPRRKMLWLDFANVLTTQLPVGAAVAILMSSLNTAALALRPFTIVRTRGLVNVATDQIAATEWPFGALGFGVAQEAAVAAGIGSLPAPITEAGSSVWFSWTPFAAQLQFSSAIGHEDASQTFEFDSKAQRKGGEW